MKTSHMGPPGPVICYNWLQPVVTRYFLTQLMNHLLNKKSQDFQIQHKRIRENQMSQAIDYQRKNGHGRNAFDMIPISKTMTSICVVDWQFFNTIFMRTSPTMLIKSISR